MLKIEVIGNLGKDAIVNQVNGKSVINFSVASTEKWKDSQGQSMEKTTWVECGYWTEKTAVVPYLKKGTQVYVEGTGEVRTWTTNEGKSGANMSCKVFSMQLLNNPAGASNGNGAQPQQQQAAPQQQAKPAAAAPQASNGGYNPVDDLPF